MTAVQDTPGAADGAAHRSGDHGACGHGSDGCDHGDHGGRVDHGRQDVGAEDRNRRRLRRGAVAGAVTAVGAAAVVATNPTDTGVPLCWSQGVFGIDCPLCGGLRCTNALLRGDVVAAADHNLVLAVVLPLVAVGWVVWMVRAWRGRPLRLPRVPVPVLGLLAVVVVAFSVARNVDAGGFVGWLASTRA